MSNSNQHTINNIKNSFGMEGYTPTPTPTPKTSKKASEKVVKDQVVPLNPPKKP